MCLTILDLVVCVCVWGDQKRVFAPVTKCLPSLRLPPIWFINPDFAYLHKNEHSKMKTPLPVCSAKLSIFRPR